MAASTGSVSKSRVRFSNSQAPQARRTKRLPVLPPELGSLTALLPPSLYRMGDQPHLTRYAASNMTTNSEDVKVRATALPLFIGLPLRLVFSAGW